MDNVLVGLSLLRPNLTPPKIRGFSSTVRVKFLILNNSTTFLFQKNHHFWPGLEEDRNWIAIPLTLSLFFDEKRPVPDIQVPFR
jgi:hypothetical protein